MLLRYPIIGLMTLGLAGVSVASAQPGPRIGLNPGGRMGLPRIGPGGKKGPGGPPPGARAAIDRWREMSPDERQQMVDRLPPERREGFRRRMEMWDSMKPEERKGVGDRFDRFRDLPPDQQKTARQAFRQFNQLAPERRQELRREMGTLRHLSDEERTAHMNSEEFRNKFDARERGMLQDLASSLPE